MDRGLPAVRPDAPLLIGLASACLVAAAAGAALSPWLRVRSVSWTGTVPPPHAARARVEAALAGRPLLLVPEPRLRAGLAPGGVLRLDVRRRLPGTLELRLEPRRAFGVLDDGTIVDGGGAMLAKHPSIQGLVRLDGFALDGRRRRLAPEGRALLDAVRAALAEPALRPATIQWVPETGDVALVLGPSGTRVRCDADDLESQLLKLRILARSLDGEPLPAWIDLRFDDQVVVREEGRMHGARARR